MEMQHIPKTTSMPDPHSPVLQARAAGEDPSDNGWIGLTPLEAVKVLLQHRRLFVVIPLVLFALVVGLGLVGARLYTSSVVFVPQLGGGSALGAASGLAEQLGISLPGVDLTQTPDFYVTLVTSRSFLRDVVNTKYRAKNDDGTYITADLVTIFKDGGGARGTAVENTVDDLAESLSAGSNLKTGIVTVAVRTKDPALSLQIANRVLQLINDFNARTRRTHATEEREFTAARLTEARKELHSAEDALQAYQEQNRIFQGSPVLVLGMERLQREVVRRDQLVSQLAQRYDQARIEEARNTASITIMEAPALASRPDRRGLLVQGLISLVVGSLIALLVAWVHQFISKYRRADPFAWEDVRDAWRATIADLRHPSRIFRRRPGLGAAPPAA
ncbi:MAG: lipopolysaccharide biosynthesis protein [Gemmatimonadetes bacterium]|nr:lipopolysaccharide biosynthesis protein [Gemmatimonadota bacterium]